MKKRLISLLLTLALALSLVTLPAAAAACNGSGLAETALTGGVVTDNESDHNYIQGMKWAATEKSGLIANADGTFTRVEYVSGTGVLIETYSAAGALQSTRTLDLPLPIWGGFYSGASYNYLVFGQSNSGASDSVEVLRVVKYDKSWNELGHYSASGINTTVPFDAGAVRMTEAGGYLYVYTCHKMYSGHQANMTFKLNLSDMSLASSYSDVMNVSYGYVSHSFNQYIATDGTYVYRIDHGDAYPRGVYWSKTAVSGGVTQVASYSTVLSIGGTIGNNYTGLSLGGLAVSSTANTSLIVGNSVDQDTGDNWKSTGQRNAFLTVVDNAAGTASTTWLTDYVLSDNVTLGNPQIVKVTDSTFLILWEEKYGDSSFYNDGAIYHVRAMMVDGSGNILTDNGLDPEADKELAEPAGKALFLNAALSDCQPVLTKDGMVTWYVSDGEAVTQYTVNPATIAAAKQYPVKSQSLTDNGYVNPDVMMAAPGDTVTFTTSHFNYWYEGDTVTVTDYAGTGKSVTVTKLDTNKYSFVMPDWTPVIQVSFKSHAYSISTHTESLNDSSISGGKLLITRVSSTGETTENAATYNGGDSITVTPVPDAGYEFASSYGIKGTSNGKYISSSFRTINDDGSYTFKLKDNANLTLGDVTFSCYFQRKSYTYTASAMENGQIYGGGKAFAGSTQTFTVHVNYDCILQGLPAVTTDSGASVAVTSLGNGQYSFVMPADNVTISAAAARLFSDVRDSGQYYYTPVYWAVEKKITTGTDSTHFSPDETCSRAQVVTFLWRAAGCPEPANTVSPFTDVQDSTAYYYKAVLWAVEKKITTGMTATTFSPDDTCSRAQIVTFLWRYENYPEPTSTVNPFVDVPSGAYYYNAVLWAVENGITKGTAADAFSPDDPCLRAQIVTFLYRDMNQ